MNLERIAEVEAACDEETLMAVIDFADIAELCRLARLGLRVEGAPTVRLEQRPPYRAKGPAALPYVPLPKEWDGRRVALVVLEESK